MICKKILKIVKKYCQIVDSFCNVSYNVKAVEVYHFMALCLCGCSSMVEFQPSKLAAWVRFPSPAPLIQRVGTTGKTYA